MKQLFKTCFFALLSTLFLSACHGKSESYNYYYSYGNILADEEGIEKGYSIILDSGNELRIHDNHVANAEVEDGNRIYAKYSILGQQSGQNGNKIFNVDLYGLNKVLEKIPVLQSDIDDPNNTEVTEESIGNDPIKINSQIVAGRYLTIEFSIYTRRGSDVSHFINLVQDDTRVPTDPEDDTVYLTLRHNGYDDVPQSGTLNQFIKTYGSVSFDLTSILPAGEEFVPIKVFWTDYGLTINDRVTYSRDHTFSYKPIGGVAMSGIGSPMTPYFSDPYLIK